MYDCMDFFSCLYLVVKYLQNSVIYFFIWLTDCYSDFLLCSWWWTDSGVDIFLCDF